MSDEMLDTLMRALAERVLESNKKHMRKIIKAIKTYVDDNSLILNDQQKETLAAAKELIGE